MTKLKNRKIGVKNIGPDRGKVNKTRSKLPLSARVRSRNQCNNKRNNAQILFRFRLFISLTEMNGSESMHPSAVAFLFWPRLERKMELVTKVHVWESARSEGDDGQRTYAPTARRTHCALALPGISYKIIFRAR